MQFELVSVMESKPTRAGLMVRHEGKVFVSVYAASGWTQYAPGAIGFDPDGGEGKQVVIAAPATLAGAVNLIGVPQDTIASAGYGWAQIYGNAEALVETGASAGDYLEVLNTEGFFTETSTTLRVSTCAGLIDSTTASTATAAATVMLFGRNVEVAATT